MQFIVRSDHYVVMKVTPCNFTDVCEYKHFKHPVDV